MFSCRYGSNGKTSFYSRSSKLPASVQNRLCVPKLGCSCWGGRGCCLQGGHPRGQIPIAALGSPARACGWPGGHESPIVHIPRGCPKTSGNQHRQRALALLGVGSRSHGTPSPVPSASAPLGSAFPEPRHTDRLLRYLQGSIRLAPWLRAKGEFPPGSEICSHLRLDADGLSVSGVNVEVTPVPRFGSGQGGRWDGSCGHHHRSEWLSWAGHSRGSPPWHMRRRPAMPPKLEGGRRRVCSSCTSL